MPENQMSLPELSDEQRQLVFADDDQFAEACPGAGKTRAIAARFLHLTETKPRKGIGLVSFTTAAIDEVRSRCGDQADALLAPNFVGTFDRFMNQFITRPVYVQRCGKTPRFRESWQGIKDARFRLLDMGKLPDIELDWFTFDGQLRATLNERRLPIQYIKILASLISTRRQELEERATTKCRDLVRAGLISCAASRALAAGYLQQPETIKCIGNLLGARFREIIVDEVQDCGPEELLVLRLLRKFGVKVVAVADMDQSIFEFRRAEPEKVRAFINTLGTPISLNGNWRSSPAICALNNSLRSSDQVEVACDRNASCEIPIQLLEFGHLGQVAPAVESLLAVHELSRGEVIFLAHRRSDARKCAGKPGEGTSLSANAVLGVARASTTLRTHDSTGKERLQAIGLVEGMLRAAADVDDLDQSVLDERWLREAAVRMAITLDPAGKTSGDYAKLIRQYIQQIRWPVGITPRRDLGAFIKAPKETDWKAPREDVPGAFAATTIHSVKGREFASAVVVLPEKPPMDDAKHHALDHWENGTPSELRRVLYVGASRAQKLLILAVHTNHLGRVAKLLKEGDVPYELVLLSSS
jgi:DNA helicase II / ATP-dependent DNA helicase PcrA